MMKINRLNAMQWDLVAMNNLPERLNPRTPNNMINLFRPMDLIRLGYELVLPPLGELDRGNVDSPPKDISPPEDSRDHQE
jgi:hypothetical protein